MSTTKSRRLLINARAVAAYAFGDEKYENAVYESLKTKELPLFKVNGKVCAYTDDLDAAMARKEQIALDAYRARALVLEKRIAARLGSATLTLGIV